VTPTPAAGETPAAAAPPRKPRKALGQGQWAMGHYTPLNANEQAKRDADERVRQLLADAQRDADQVLADATAAATRLRAEADADAEQRRATAQRDLNELTKQKDEVARHLAQMRQLVGSLLPDGLD